MKRDRAQDIESRLRREAPSDMQAPTWVRTRVLVSMDAAQDIGAASTRSGKRLALGAFAMAVLALTVSGAIWLSPAQPVPQGDGWRLAMPDTMPRVVAVRLPGALEDEARNIRADVVDLLGVVRVPMEKLTQASKQFAGSV